MKTVIAKSKLIIVILSFITLSGGMSSSVAQASEASQAAPAWICALNFNGVSKSAQIIIGQSKFNGAGTIKCVSATNERREYPVLVTMKSQPIAPKVGLGKMHLYGEALQIAIMSGNPEVLLGDYLVLEGRGSIIGGAGVIAATKVSENNLSLSISLQLTKGIGFDVGFRTMKIELDSTRL